MDCANLSAWLDRLEISAGCASINHSNAGVNVVSDSTAVAEAVCTLSAQVGALSQRLELLRQLLQSKINQLKAANEQLRKQLGIEQRFET